MSGRVMRVDCPHCSRTVMQFVDTSGPNVCPNCYRMFQLPLPKRLPSWIWCVLAVLAANLFWFA